MDPETNKNKPLTKEETKGLLSLIERSKIINNKKTNAASNKMKVEEWLNITNEFNATVGTCRQNHQQLRLKWENLKKNSRKRSTLLRMDRIKTGGGPPGYFPPDEILDRVASLLGSTGEGFTVMFGGDAEPQNFDGGDEIPTPMLLVDNSVSTNVASTSSMTTYEDPIGNDMPTSSIGDNNSIMLDNSGARNRSIKMSGNKRRFKKNEDWCQARNKAIAEYYILKKTYLEGKFENVVLENEKLKLEIKKLKGEDTK